jgi:hypothetical protein
MKRSTLWLSALFIFVVACQKDITQTNQLSTNNTIDAKANDVDSTGWYGKYFDRSEGDPDDTSILKYWVLVYANELIQNGEARIKLQPSIDSTEIIFDMPDNHIINADSSSFDITLLNQNNTVDLNIFGINNVAKLTYKANQLNDSGYYSMSVGNTSVQFTVYPATDFTSFKLLRFAFKQNKAYVYVSNKLITSFKYAQSNKIGNLTRIQIGKYGFIESDNVKLYNCFTRKLLMREDFNIAGHSHTIFY